MLARRHPRRAFSGGALFAPGSICAAEPYVHRLELLHPPALTILAMQHGVPMAAAPVGPAGVQFSRKSSLINTKHLVHPSLTRWVRSSTRVGYSTEFHQAMVRLSYPVTDPGHCENHGLAGHLCRIRILVAQRVAVHLPAAQGDDQALLKGQDGSRHPRAPWLARAVPPSP